jgi:ferredoxin
MHSYEPLWAPDGSDDPPGLEEFRFRSALDIVSYAQHWCCIGRNTWPEVWHLDDEGAFHCGFRASSRDSIREWARDPDDLCISRQQGLATRACPNRWLIVESRPESTSPHAVVDERDAQAFLQLRRRIVQIDPVLELVDVMIFDDAYHWWSLHELTTGTMEWPAVR